MNHSTRVLRYHRGKIAMDYIGRLIVLKFIMEDESMTDEGKGPTTPASTLHAEENRRAVPITDDMTSHDLVIYDIKRFVGSLDFWFLAVFYAILITPRNPLTLQSPTLFKLEVSNLS